MSSEKDEFDKQTTALLRSFFLTTPHKAVAAALREQGKQIADLRAEVKRLRGIVDKDDVERMEFHAERDQLKAQIAELTDERNALANCDRCEFCSVHSIGAAMEGKP